MSAEFGSVLANSLRSLEVCITNVPKLIKKVTTLWSRVSDNQISSYRAVLQLLSSNWKRKMKELCQSQRRGEIAPLIVLEANAIQSDTILSGNQYWETKSRLQHWNCLVMWLLPARINSPCMPHCLPRLGIWRGGPRTQNLDEICKRNCSERSNGV